MGEAFDNAMGELAALDPTESDLTRPVLRAVPLSGASVSTLGGLLAQETVSASDAQAGRLDELQFDLGEGPCWDAVSTGQPVIEPDVQRHPSRVWPGFSEALRDEPIGALFAFPLSVGTLRFGALDLYDREPSTLTDTQAARIDAMTALISRHVLRRAIRLARDVDAAPERSGHSRRAVHQATGFVIAQLGLAPDDAHLLIQGQALAQGQSMAEVAEDIIARRLTFVRNADRIEAER
ncbi:GAF and ANTAR domain-containing protein [Agromyces sp. NPDC056523]|uniref:GAF and ANTAR domain-containing protein n=1 Tax=Agromyces sp. NPDC056523 TaxID=3345850 RepID=UPI00366BEED7